MPATNNTLNILACQLLVPETTSVQQRDQHLEHSAQLLRSTLQQSTAQGHQTDLVVLPELSAIEYSRASFEKLHELAEPDHGPSFTCWSAVARDNQCAIVYGFPRSVSDGYRISAGASVSGRSNIACGCLCKR